MICKKKNKVSLEYELNSPPSILFQRLSTPHGLSEWFADDVNISGNIFTFIWDDDIKKAELVENKRNKLVKFKWLDGSSSSCHFSFELIRDEMTGVLALHVTEDIAENNEADDTITLWNHQIGELKRVLGA